MSFELQGRSDFHPFSVQIVDDDKVVYGYLLENGSIVGDVWLYNRMPAPAVPEWELPDGRERLPFLNPRRFVRNSEGETHGLNDFEVRWSERGVAIYLYGKILAIIMEGDKPGRCRNAVSENQVARVLKLPTEGEG
ncbi:MAG TPA: hypothetical protein VK934_03820 [Fimbriimonas sp.]|nr:hypothetical protein [Fimbriimonas sp.]